MIRCFATILVLVFCLWSGSGLASVRHDLRHVYILEGGVDQVWGSYFFVVENTAAKPVVASFRLLLPEEVIDWRVQDGLDASKVSLGKDGGVYVNQSFPAGSTLVRMSFLAPAVLGKTTLTFNPTFSIADLRFMAPEGGLSLSSEGAISERDMSFGRGVFASVRREQISVPTVIELKIDGVPEGRMRYWVLGAGFMLLLCLVVFALGLRTRPVLTDDSALDGSS